MWRIQEERVVWWLGVVQREAVSCGVEIQKILGVWWCGVAQQPPAESPWGTRWLHPLFCHCWWLLGAFLLGFGMDVQVISWGLLILLLGHSGDGFMQCDAKCKRLKSCCGPRYSAVDPCVSSLRFPHLSFFICYMNGDTRWSLSSLPNLWLQTKVMHSIFSWGGSAVLCWSHNLSLSWPLWVRMSMVWTK